MTILFSDVVGFTSICSRISPLEVVAMLNDMYTKFDQLTELHKVYKVRSGGNLLQQSGRLPFLQVHRVYMHFYVLTMPMH